jgi:hypothetical protein
VPPWGRAFFIEQTLPLPRERPVHLESPFSAEQYRPLPWRTLRPCPHNRVWIRAALLAGVLEEEYAADGKNLTEKPEKKKGGRLEFQATS